MAAQMLQAETPRDPLQLTLTTPTQATMCVTMTPSSSALPATSLSASIPPVTGHSAPYWTRLRGCLPLLLRMPNLPALWQPQTRLPLLTTHSTRQSHEMINVYNPLRNPYFFPIYAIPQANFIGWNLLSWFTCLANSVLPLKHAQLEKPHTVLTN